MIKILELLSFDQLLSMCKYTGVLGKMYSNKSTCILVDEFNEFELFTSNKVNVNIDGSVWSE